MWTSTLPDFRLPQSIYKVVRSFSTVLRLIPARNRCHSLLLSLTSLFLVKFSHIVLLLDPHSDTSHLLRSCCRYVDRSHRLTYRFGRPLYPLHLSTNPFPASENLYDYILQTSLRSMSMGILRPLYFDLGLLFTFTLHSWTFSCGASTLDFYTLSPLVG